MKKLNQLYKIKKISRKKCHQNSKTHFLSQRRDCPLPTVYHHHRQTNRVKLELLPGFGSGCVRCLAWTEILCVYMSEREREREGRLW